ncbi:MAG TPA: rhamnulokinase family protein [Ilumatobacteraceae bacterium]|nr:rhamnulokinase family protein [Ilumatobacteraceae bacterium]
MTNTFAAVDLGATSGRVVVGQVSPSSLVTNLVTRFPNRPIRTTDGLHWNITGLFRHVLDGLAKSIRSAPDLESVGVDAWAVDYGLLRGDRLLGEPFHYRDDRTARGVDATHAIVPFDELYERNGLQFLPFTSIYQLAVDRLDGMLAVADGLLLIPDLLDFWLTGRRAAERTNASTTGLVNITTGGWDHDVACRLGIPRYLFPDLVEPGESIGVVTSDVAESIGASASLQIVAVGSHDTASAVVGVPMDPSSAAFISCGTWGLVGVETELPVLTSESRRANFTNERGVDGRVRFLRNVMGLWLLSESVRAWESGGDRVDLAALLSAATAVDAPVAVFDVNDPAFLPPGNMPLRIAEHCELHNLPVPRSPAEFTRSIVESLAHAFAESVRLAAELSGRDVETVHMVGGGAQNELLCQRTADHLGTTLVAGPVEATALGNIVVQARAAGVIVGGLETLRALVAKNSEIRRYTPRTCPPGR